MTKVSKLFWDKVRILGPDDCWNWLASVKSGYGHFTTGSRHGLSQSAHRTSYMLSKGPINDGLHVCHTCDNPLCVNPNHLFLGTPQENTQDMLSKQRSARGEKNTKSKLKESDIVSIRSDLRSSKEIALEYGVKSLAINRIKRNIYWRHV